MAPRSNDAREREKWRKAAIAETKTAILEIIRKVKKMNREKGMSAGPALEIVTQEIREWRL